MGERSSVEGYTVRRRTREWHREGKGEQAIEGDHNKRHGGLGFMDIAHMQGGRTSGSEEG